ncbi:MAG: hypothetical protein WCP39_05330 [Chlamydiota bacterium]
MLTLTAIDAKSDEENFSQERDVQQEDIPTIWQFIPLYDYCVERTEGEKVYLKDEYVLASNSSCFIYTSSFGRLDVKNITKDEYGFYLPKIQMIVKENQKIQWGACRYQFQKCEWTPEVDQHLDKAMDHGLNAAAALGGAGAFAATGQPILGGVTAAIGVKEGFKAVDELHEAWKSYNNNSNNTTSNEHDNRNESSDSRDSVSGNPCW